MSLGEWNVSTCIHVHRFAKISALVENVRVSEYDL